MIPKGKGLPKFADDATLNQIRGKAMVGHQTLEDVWTLLDHLQLLEHVLDEEVDANDGLGPSGWREHMEAESAQWAQAVSRPYTLIPCECESCILANTQGGPSGSPRHPPHASPVRNLHRHGKNPPAGRYSRGATSRHRTGGGEIGERLRAQFGIPAPRGDEPR